MAVYPSNPSIQVQRHRASFAKGFMVFCHKSTAEPEDLPQRIGEPVTQAYPIIGHLLQCHRTDDNVRHQLSFNILNIM